MNSNAISNLQFESTYNEDLKTYRVKKGSARLICPKCKHEHTYEDARWMNINGGWIHKVPELIDEHVSFQFGALASQLKALSWDFIAQEQLDAGKSADIELQMNFDNSIRRFALHPSPCTEAGPRGFQDSSYMERSAIPEERGDDWRDCGRDGLILLICCVRV